MSNVVFGQTSHDLILYGFNQKEFNSFELREVVVKFIFWLGTKVGEKDQKETSCENESSKVMQIILRNLVGNYELGI